MLKGKEKETAHSTFSNIVFFVSLLFKISPTLVIGEFLMGILTTLPTRLISVVGLKYIIDVVTEGEKLERIFFAVVIIALILMSKDASKLKLGFGIYLFDCMCLIPLAMVMGGIQPEFFIDVTVHLFVVVFVSTGLQSFRQLQQSTTA